MTTQPLSEISFLGDYSSSNSLQIGLILSTAVKYRRSTALRKNLSAKCDFYVILKSGQSSVCQAKNFDS